ncbi:hypothetical protein FKM82_026877 [Ascaphus truei]
MPWAYIPNIFISTNIMKRTFPCMNKIHKDSSETMGFHRQLLGYQHKAHAPTFRGNMSHEQGGRHLKTSTVMHKELPTGCARTYKDGGAPSR